MRQIRPKKTILGKSSEKVMIQAYTQTLNEFVKESRPRQPLNHTGDTGQHDLVLSRASSLLHALLSDCKYRSLR